MARHDKAPWIFTEHWDEDEPGEIRCISSEEHGALATVVWRMEDGESSPKCEANAKLILAAPDLLDALKQVNALLYSKGIKLGSDDYFKARSIIVNAIHKAGEEM